MNKLLEDEDSADEEFWGQDAFAEEEGDGVYESESEKEDVFDDDFSDDESFDDAYDEFDDDPIPTHMRAPPNATGMRLLTPESDASLNSDRAWPGPVSYTHLTLPTKA